MNQSPFNLTANLNRNSRQNVLASTTLYSVAELFLRINVEEKARDRQGWGVGIDTNDRGIVPCQAFHGLLD